MIAIVITTIVVLTAFVGLLWAYEVSKRRAEWWREWNPDTPESGSSKPL